MPPTALEATYGAPHTTQPLAPAPLLHLPLSSCSSTFSSCSFTFSSCSSTFSSCSSTSDGDTAPRAAWPRIPIWGARTPDQQTTAQSSCYDTRLRPGSVQPVQLINPLGNDADPEQLLHLAQGCLSENGTTAEGSACELYGTPDMTMEILDSAQRGPVRTHRRAPARRHAPLCVPRAPHVAAQSLASGRLASPRVRTRPPASRPSRPARARASGSTPWRAGRTGGSSLTMHADPAASNQRQTYCSSRASILPRLLSYRERTNDATAAMCRVATSSRSVEPTRTEHGRCKAAGWHGGSGGWASFHDGGARDTPLHASTLTTKSTA